MESSKVTIIKQEGVSIDSVSVSTNPPRPEFAEHSSLSEVSIALISPGFSKTVLNDPISRESLRLSLSVKSRQQDLIQQRLNESETNLVRKTLKKAPRKLSLDAGRAISRQIGPHTAPLQGSRSWPRDGRSLSTYHPYQRNTGGSTEIRTELRNRLPPLRTSNLYSNSPVSLPSFKPILPAKRIPLPLAAAHAYHPSTPSIKPPTPPHSSHGQQSLPFSSPTEVADDGKTGSTGLDALSRAARLKVMKEDYLRSCSDGFDAFHGLLL